MAIGEAPFGCVSLRVGGCTTGRCSSFCNRRSRTCRCAARQPRLRRACGRNPAAHPVLRARIGGNPVQKLDGRCKCQPFQPPFWIRLLGPMIHGRSSVVSKPSEIASCWIASSAPLQMTWSNLNKEVVQVSWATVINHDRLGVAPTVTAWLVSPGVPPGGTTVASV